MSGTRFASPNLNIDRKSEKPTINSTIFFRTLRVIDYNPRVEVSTLNPNLLLSPMISVITKINMIELQSGWQEYRGADPLM
jgi:hypothetical protein